MNPNTIASDTLVEAVARAYRRFMGRCDHDWRDDYDFVSCWTLTIYSDDRQPTKTPRTIQTMQFCARCADQRRKPNSARPAISGKRRNARSIPRNQQRKG